MLSVTFEPLMPSVIMLNVVMLGITFKPLMLSVIMLSVVAPVNWPTSTNIRLTHGKIKEVDPMTKDHHVGNVQDVAIPNVAKHLQLLFIFVIFLSH